MDAVEALLRHLEPEYVPAAPARVRRTWARISLRVGNGHNRRRETPGSFRHGYLSRDRYQEHAPDKDPGHAMLSHADHGRLLFLHSAGRRGGGRAGPRILCSGRLSDPHHVA